jgi:hypothetical protein
MNKQELANLIQTEAIMVRINLSSDYVRRTNGRMDEDMTELRTSGL